MDHEWERQCTRQCPCTDWHSPDHDCKGFQGKRRLGLLPEEKITRYQCAKCGLIFDHRYGVDFCMSDAIENIEKECIK